MKKKDEDFGIQKIYIIRNTVNDFVYIGRTIKSLKRRLSEHMTQLRRWTCKSFIWRKDFKEFGEESFYIELVEYVPDDKNAVEVEAYWIDKFAKKSMVYNKVATDTKDIETKSHTRHMLVSAFFAKENK